MKRLRWLLLPLALLGVGVGVVYTPDLPLDQLKTRYAPPPSKFLALDGLDVHYRDEGAGPIVLLLHGTGASLHTWDDWTKNLSVDHRVVRLDLPGFGLTGPAADGDYRIATMVAFVDAFAQKVHLDHFAVAGNSWGGEIAWTYALEHPEHVDKLILVDAAGWPRYGALPIAFRLAKMPVVGQLFTKLGTRRIVDKTVHDVYGDPSRIREEVRRRYFDLARREGNRTSFGARLKAEHVDRTGELAKIKAPTLILWGSEDHLLPVENAEKFHAAIPGSTVKTYPGAGHVPMEEIPEETLKDVREFLR
jgi:pimeloyl-ACP methyl ester carboxylesterase